MPATSILHNEFIRSEFPSSRLKRSHHQRPVGSVGESAPSKDRRRRAGELKSPQPVWMPSILNFETNSRRAPIPTQTLTDTQLSTTRNLHILSTPSAQFRPRNTAPCRPSRRILTCHIMETSQTTLSRKPTRTKMFLPAGKSMGMSHRKGRARANLAAR